MECSIEWISKENNERGYKNHGLIGDCPLEWNSQYFPGYDRQRFSPELVKEWQNKHGDANPAGYVAVGILTPRIFATKVEAKAEHARLQKLAQFADKNLFVRQQLGSLTRDEFIAALKLGQSCDAFVIGQQRFTNEQLDAIGWFGYADDESPGVYIFTVEIGGVPYGAFVYQPYDEENQCTKEMVVAEVYGEWEEDA